MPARPGPAPEGALGVAFDLGTTTLVGALVDIPSARVLETVSRANPQRAWGPDLVSRVNAAATPSVREELAGELIRACDDITRELVEGRDEPVALLAAAGNSVMEHLFLGLEVDCFARVPYRPLFTEGRELSAADAGLSAAPDAGLYVFPLVGGFVGGDAVAVMLALGLGRGGETALAIDIGTNSEIMLSAGGRIYATSAAAGPAFEGGNISSGMVAGPGAIAGVKMDGDGVRLDVIGGARPAGICGSGLIDAVSGLVGAGVIDRSGRIRDADEVDTNLSVRIAAGRAGEGNSFVLHRDARGVVAITQEDVRSLQTAKAAIRAGVEVLFAKAGIDAGDVERVWLAGAFGSNIDMRALAGIGVIDAAWLPVTGFTGDAALDGVVKVLASAEERAEAARVAAEAGYVPLSGSRRFEEEFIRSMEF